MELNDSTNNKIDNVMTEQRLFQLNWQ